MFNNSEWFTVSDQVLGGYFPKRFYQNGDTIVNGKKYYRVITEIVDVDLNGIQLYYYINFGISSIDYYREDIENKQVWLVGSNFEHEYLIYDFGIEEGDFLPGDTTYVLNKIDTIELNDGLHRRFTFINRFNNSNKSIWIEGVGDIMQGGLSFMGGKYYPPDGVPGVLCFTQNGEVVYNERALARGLTSDFCGSYVTVPTENMLSIDPDMRVFPNPGTTSISIQSAILEQTPASWTVRDVLGREVLAESQKAMLNNQQINIEKLDAGIYFLTVYVDSKQQTLRFVKQ